MQPVCDHFVGRLHLPMQDASRRKPASLSGIYVFCFSPAGSVFKSQPEAIPFSAFCFSACCCINFHSLGSAGFGSSRHRYVQTCLMPMKPNQLLFTQIEGEPRAQVVEHNLNLPLAAEILMQRLCIKPGNASPKVLGSIGGWHVLQRNALCQSV